MLDTCFFCLVRYTDTSETLWDLDYLVEASEDRKARVNSHFVVGGYPGFFELSCGSRVYVIRMDEQGEISITVGADGTYAIH